ncbi:uncharacterized protein LOC144105567 [Amblyomma americanum]
MLTKEKKKKKKQASSGSGFESLHRRTRMESHLKYTSMRWITSSSKGVNDKFFIVQGTYDSSSTALPKREYRHSFTKPKDDILEGVDSWKTKLTFLFSVAAILIPYAVILLQTWKSFGSSGNGTFDGSASDTTPNLI